MARALTPLEARVLGVLVEKQATVPDAYPLTLNALVTGCNQKTARDPVLSATDAEVLTAADGLKQLSLLFESSGGRVSRYEQNMARGLGLPGAACALLATLALRGPQTSAELRANSERLHRFADISSVEGFLEELASKTPPRVLHLPRAPGEREARWAHLLCGEVLPYVARQFSGSAGSGGGEDAVGAGELAALKAELTRQGDELARLRRMVEAMAGELGMALSAADSGSGGNGG